MTISISLNQETWDLELDDFNNIKIITNSNAIAQNVATALRTVKGEQYYQNDKGIPYFNVLGENVPINFISALLEQEALKVADVASVRADLDQLSNRKLTGTVFFIDSLGENNGITF
jgi:hypothetical protein